MYMNYVLLEAGQQSYTNIALKASVLTDGLVFMDAPQSLFDEYPLSLPIP